jgi:glycosyltransferase involved in cell wall biosynthesis
LCLIAGKVWKDDFSSYQNIIDRLGIQESVRTDIRFVGDDEIKYYFNAADVVALPYRQIYQSGVVQLAYAYEKAIVATKVGEFLSVIKPDETGILINPGNADELADALIWYLDNPKQAAAYGKAGKADIMVRLSWDTIGKSVVAVYEKTIK